MPGYCLVIALWAMLRISLAARAIGQHCMEPIMSQRKRKSKAFIVFKDRRPAGLEETGRIARFRTSFPSVMSL